MFSKVDKDIIEKLYSLYKSDFVLMNYSNFTDPYFPLALVNSGELNINSLFTSIFSYCILSSLFTSDLIKSLCIKLFYCIMLFYHKFENSMKKVYIFSPWCLKRLLYHELFYE